VSPDPKITVPFSLAEHGVEEMATRTSDQVGEALEILRAELFGQKLNSEPRPPNRFEIFPDIPLTTFGVKIDYVCHLLLGGF
jgi:hypothetical protein